MSEAETTMAEQLPDWHDRLEKANTAVHEAEKVSREKRKELAAELALELGIVFGETCALYRNELVRVEGLHFDRYRLLKARVRKLARSGLEWDRSSLEIDPEKLLYLYQIAVSEV